MTSILCSGLRRTDVAEELTVDEESRGGIAQGLRFAELCRAVHRVLLIELKRSS
jgi:hypothetical protein